jgi:hypothetical protein
MPKDSQMGISKGDTINIAEYMSMRQPTRSKKTFSKSKKRIFE